MLDLLLRFVIPAAYHVLPTACASPEATAMLIAIALQESNLTARWQHVDRLGVHGPAHGFWQFEVSGVIGVAEHRATKALLAAALDQLIYPPTILPSEVHQIIEDNDIVACIVARLALWRLHAALPQRGNPDEGWRQYMQVWRPGQPRPREWARNYDAAWMAVTAS